MHTNLVPSSPAGSSGCPSFPACTHWIWNHGWPRCEACPSGESNDDEPDLWERRIDVPPPLYLIECRTRFAMSLAYAALPTRIDATGLGNFVKEVIRRSDVIVVDYDGIPFDFQRMDIYEMFTDFIWNDSFLKAKLTCVWNNEEPIIAARIKLLWIALAIIDEGSAQDTLM